MKLAEKRFTPLAIAVVAALTGAQPLAFAQTAETDTGVPEPAQPYYQDDEVLDEVTVTGRFISSSQQLVNERMNDAFATDLLGEDTIKRLGDSTVASALRRVPGLSLVQDKFVYIRGLGERYSQTTLNGAAIPSPDLTRNVIPLDLFPTAVVESLRVQKSYSPEVSANFGGGAVDIRTKGIPDAFTFKADFGLGFNSENPSNVFTYKGGGDDSLGTDDGSRELPSSVFSALARYRGEINTSEIERIERFQDPTFSQFDASLINRQLALDLNLGALDVRTESVSPDYNARLSIGNSWEINSDWQVGAAVSGSYDTDTRWRRTRTRDSGEETRFTQFGVREESTVNVSIAGTANFGVSYLDDHTIETTHLYLRNTDDETEIFDFFNENQSFSPDSPSGQSGGFRNTRLEFEERNMTTNQIEGEHFLGDDTRSKFPIVDKLFGWLSPETKISWFYSDSNATTEIPSRIVAREETVVDNATLRVLETKVRARNNATEYRYTDLDDEVSNHGGGIMAPFDWGNNYIEVSAGGDHRQKARTYRTDQFTFGFQSPLPDESFLEGALDDVYSEANILATTGGADPTGFVNSFEFSTQDNRNSYLAATMTDAVWGKVDWTWNDTWRVAVGARWEDYRQAALSWDPNGFSLADPQVTTDPEELEDSTFKEDKVYPAVGITYMGDFWAETFQLRLGYSETAIRPDLREIVRASYVDALTGDVVQGNPDIVPAELENIDLRAEWLFGSGDNLTVTLYQKDITNPIDFLELGASDTVILRGVFNAESGETRGVEVEFLKELGFLGDFWDMFFVQGNLTFQETEVVVGDNAPNQTNAVRELAGASEYLVNFMIGFDSPNSQHTASLIYNTFGERLFVPGRNGEPDAFEQPFNSLDFTYFWYPTDTLTVKVKAQNLLGETISIEKGGVPVFEEDPGTSFVLGFTWGF